MATRGTPQTPKRWVVRWGDHVLREQEMTLGDCEQIEKLTGRNWFTINPTTDAKHAVAIVAVMTARLTGRDVDDVLAEVRMVPLDRYLDAIDVEDDDTPAVWQDGNPPMAARRTATSRGSGSRPGAGRRK